MNKRGPASGVMPLLGGFIATSIVLGIVLAGLMIPAVGIAGIGVANSISTYQNLPGELENEVPAQESRILAADGSLIVSPASQSRLLVTSAQIPKIMKQAQVAIEDERFYEHGALDGRGFMRALASNISTNTTQGASTITQQYVKIALHDKALRSGDTKAAQAATARTGVAGYMRKIRQLRYAVTIEERMTKDQILTAYLNMVYMGDKQYGIGAATRHYFGKTVDKLTLPEAALLAGLVQLPSKTDPIHHPEAAKNRRNVVLQKMYEQKMITAAQYKQAVAAPIKITRKDPPRTCTAAKYPYACEYVLDWLKHLPALGDTIEERERRIYQGGLTIKTTFEPKQMKMLLKEVRRRVPENNDANIQAAAVVIEPKTGYIVATAQNTKYGNSGKNGTTSINYATPTHGGTGGFPIGSVAKAFAIAAALDSGKRADEMLEVPRSDGSDRYGGYKLYNSTDFPGECGLATDQVWKVRNEHFIPPGPMRLTTATGQSVNTVFTELVKEIGACKVHKYFELFGVLDGNTRKPIAKLPSNIVLGSANSSPVMMAGAFGAFGVQGKFCEPRPVSKITDAAGQEIDLKLPKCKDTIPEEHAAGLAQALRTTAMPGGTAPWTMLSGRRENLGKTGTVDGAVHSWYVGATPQYSTAVWVGRAGKQEAMRNVSLGGRYYGGYVYGGTIAGPIWKSIMDRMHIGKPFIKLDTPDYKVNFHNYIVVPNVDGNTVARAKAILNAAGFKVRVGPARDSAAPKGRVAATSPGGGAKVRNAGTVTIYPSTGEKPKPKKDQDDTKKDDKKPKKPAKKKK